MDYTFQIGVDIATAASIIGASTMFIINQVKQYSKNKQDQELAIFKGQKFRMIETLGSYVVAYGDKYASFVRDIHEGKSNPDDLVHETQRIMNYCRFFATPVFSAFSATRDLEVISHIMDRLTKWNSNLVEGFTTGNVSLINFQEPAEIVAEGIAKMLKE
jgi:hypothetical protein